LKRKEVVKWRSDIFSCSRVYQASFDFGEALSITEAQTLGGRSEPKSLIGISAPPKYDKKKLECIFKDQSVGFAPPFHSRDYRPEGRAQREADGLQ